MLGDFLCFYENCWFWFFPTTEITKFFVFKVVFRIIRIDESIRLIFKNQTGFSNMTIFTNVITIGLHNPDLKLMRKKMYSWAWERPLNYYGLRLVWPQQISSPIKLLWKDWPSELCFQWQQSPLCLDNFERHPVSRNCRRLLGAEDLYVRRNHLFKSSRSLISIIMCN
jgi:hypothetical protein